MGGSSAAPGTSLLLLAVSSTERRALESSPGPALSSTRTTTSLEAVRSFRMTAATTTEEVQGRSSLLPTSSRTSSRMSSWKSVLASTTQAASTPQRPSNTRSTPWSGCSSTLVENNSCNNKLKSALNQQRAG